MKSVWILLFCCFLPCAAQEPAHTPPPLLAPIQDKNFYLLSAIERSPSALAAVTADPALAAIARTKLAAIEAASAACNDCLAAIQFTAAEIDMASAALRNLYRTSAALRSVIDGPVRSSGMYIRHHDRAGDDLLVQAWTSVAGGINHIVDIYGAGKKPRYDQIDAVSFNATAPGYKSLIETIAGVLSEKKSFMPAFFQPSLNFALYLLDANKRDEAGRHEPMESGVNQAAFRAIPATDWDRYPYTVIVVPGSGADRPTWSISPNGKLRTELAALRYKQGKAPFILVSGGYVHPNQTPFAEAIEMKRVLVEEYGVPAASVIVDPHARHTTTNMRNAARLMYRYGIPFDRKALVTTDKSQSAYIEGDGFTRRCLSELGYEPYKLGRRISIFDLEFIPRIDSLQIDANDPLDP